MIEKQKQSAKDAGSWENDMPFEKQDSSYSDDLSQRILKKWRSGVIICTWPKLFWNEDEIEMI